MADGDVVTEDQKLEAMRAVWAQVAQDGETIRSLLQHPGMKVMQKRIDLQVNRDKSRWYEATNAEEAEKIRQETRGYESFFVFAKKLMIEGEAAKKNLAATQPPSAEAEQGA